MNAWGRGGRYSYQESVRTGANYSHCEFRMGISELAGLAGQGLGRIYDVDQVRGDNTGQIKQGPAWVG
jgi:hypothetical protein